MADFKPPKSKSKSKKEKPEDSDLLKADVASFVSSIGLSPAISASLSDSGFNDSDFRKKGPLRPSKSDKFLGSDPLDETFSDKNKQSRGKIEKKRNQARVSPSKNDKRITGGKVLVKNSGKLMNSFSESEKQDKNGREVSAKDRARFPLMKAGSLSGQWYVDASDLEGKVIGGEGTGVEVKDLKEWNDLVQKKEQVAQMLMQQYSSDYELSRGKSGDMRMVSAAQRSGTAADKVAAFTVLVQDNPIANLRSLDALLAMVTSNVGKRHALTGFDALKELFLMSLLPERKLKCLKQWPLNNLPDSKDGFSLLLFWYWEDCLKKRYERFIVALEEASKDPLPALKDKSLKTMYALLTGKAEQERRLLSALVNKLGDPERKAASGAVYHLTCLLSAHPNMKAVVIEEVDRFILRKHLGLRAKYHAINFLTQIFLSKKGDGPKIAKHLVKIYFDLFKVLISEVDNAQKSKKDSEGMQKKGAKSLGKSKEESPSDSSVEMDSRLLSALLTGVNRAFPYVSADEADAVIELQTPVLFKLVHSKNFNVGVQALMLLYQISAKNQIASDRFYRALYSKLLVPAVMKSSKPEMFLGLLFKAMKSDVNLKRVCSFSKRLLQVALQQPPQYACGCLFILSEVLKARPPLWNTVLQSESIDEDFEHFEDIIEDSHNDPNTAPTKSGGNSIGFGSVRNGNGTVKIENSSSDVDNGESPQNLYYNEDNSDGEEKLLGAATDGNSLSDMGKLETVYDGEREQAQILKSRASLPRGYDPRHREPSYCNADRTSWWELSMLASHVHPSVATMARTLLSGANIIYSGDPLNDLSLSAFLDKFVEKKPKPNRRADGIWHGGSQIAPARKLEMSNTLIGPEILSLAEEDVPPEDLVFHRFYMNKQSSTRKKPKKKKDRDEDAQELYDVGRGEGEEREGDEMEDDVNGDDESDDEEIDNLLGSGARESDGDYDYDNLDEVVKDGDEDLLGSGSDADVDSLHGDGDADVDNDEDDDVDFGDGDDDDEDDDDDEGDKGSGNQKKRKLSGRSGNKKKQKLSGRSGASPFASLEEYEELLNEDAKKGSKYKNKFHKKKKEKKSA